MPKPVNIARCPEHGLHGQRTECFVCHGPVEQVAMVPVGPSALQCANTDDSGEIGWVPLRADTVSSAAALAVMLAAAEAWGTPLCATCQKPPTLGAYRENPEDDDLLIPLDHDDPAVELRYWCFEVLEWRDTCACPAQRQEQGPDA